MNDERAVDLSCPLCAAWAATGASRADVKDVPVSAAQAALTFGWWMAENAGTHDQVCASHRAQFEQLERMFRGLGGTPVDVEENHERSTAIAPHADCRHPVVLVIRAAIDSRIEIRVGTDRTARAEWCDTCGAIRLADGRWIAPRGA